MTRRATDVIGIQFYLSPQQVTFLDAIAVYQSISRTEVMRRLLDEAMARDAARRAAGKGETK